MAPSVKRMLEYEASWGIDRPEQYRGFARKVEQIRTGVLEILARLKRAGASIGGKGALAKGNTLLNFLGLTPATIEYIAEINE